MSKAVVASVLVTFSTLQVTPFSSIARAQTIELPAPGVMLNLSPPLRPPILQGLTIHPENPFRFDFIVDRGESRLQADELKSEYEKLVKYFLATLTIPEKDLWVNLSPYEQNRIIPQEFGLTEMGRDMLAQDYILKQLAASLTYPESGLGKKFWDEVYKKAYEQFGIKDIPLNTLSKVWIIPDKAVVYEHKDKAFIMQSHLKVMLEEDYLALHNTLKNDGSATGALSEDQAQQINGVISRVTKEVLIPAIEKEVNEGENFARLRQIYHSMILAVWYKKTLKSNLLNRVYSNQKKIAGVENEDPQAKEKIYQQYLTAFQKGVYNYIKEDYDTQNQVTIPRKYFSGGFDWSDPDIETTAQADPRDVKRIEQTGRLEQIVGDYAPPGWRQGEVAQASSPIATPEAIRKSLKAFEYRGWKSSGVDLEHFVHAQSRLAQRTLPPEILVRIMRHLDVNPNLPASEAYPQIYAKLAKGKYTKEIIDLINSSSDGQSTYADPRLSVTIVGQNRNPRAQGINEAVSNSVDAILERIGLNDLKIGQFGLGVKQVIDWLTANGQDQIDVATRQAGAAPNTWLRLTIFKDKEGQLYIQIFEIASAKAFEKIFGFPPVTTQGTVVRIKVKDAIPRGRADIDDRRRNSQEAMADEGIHRRFAYLSHAVRITTQIGDDARRKVNGIEQRKYLMGTPVPEVSERGDIHVAFSDHAITIIDNGIGMDAETISRMFVPKEGTKEVKPLSEAERLQERDKKIKVVHDPSLPHRVSFARNGEVIEAVDIPDTIVANATVPGGIMMEFGRLIDVPESRDQVRIPLDLKPGEISNFQLAAAYMIQGVVKNATISDQEKVAYVNTMIIGLEQLVKGNANYEHVISLIRTQAKEALAPVIARLKKEGVVFLPHEKQFEKLAIAAGQRVMFVHEHLFNWQGAMSLKELGGQIVPGITVVGPKRLPLVVAPFVDHSLATVSRFNEQWHTWSEARRLPVIETDRFVAVPSQFGQRLIELATKRIYGGLSEQEQQEFSQLAELINIVIGAETTTSYEVSQVPPQMNIATPDEIQQSTGPDAKAVSRFNDFLKNPPITDSRARPQEQALVPADAGQRFILVNGSIVEVGTGKKIMEKVETLKYVGHDYYEVLAEDSEQKGTGPLITKRKLVELRPGKSPLDTYSFDSFLGEIVLSPDQKFAYVNFGAMPKSHIVDLENKNRLPLNTMQGQSLADVLLQGFPAFIDLEFSADGKYLTYKGPHEGTPSVFIVDLQQRKNVFITKSTPDYAINPFADVAYLNYGTATNPSLNLIDLKDGTIVISGVKHLHTDATGTYTVIILQDGKKLVYVHKSRKLLTPHDPAFRGRVINAVMTAYYPKKIVYKIADTEKNNYVFNEEGILPEIIEDDSRPKPDFLEIVLDEAEGETTVAYGTGAKEVLVVRMEEDDPLQRLDKTLVYKHPQYDLFIDRSHSEEPVAINAKTGEKIKFSGDFLWTAGDLIFYAKKGELFSADRYGDVFVDGKILAMNKNVNEISQETKWIVLLSQEQLKLQKWGKKFTEPIRKIPKQYSEVSFDGKYFVFVNPQTGDVAYLDPEDIDHPVFVGKTAPEAAPVARFSKTRPADAPQQITIVENSDGTYSLRGANRDNVRFRRIVRINPETVVAFEQGLDIGHIYVNGEQILEFAGSLISHTDKLLVVEAQVAGQNIQFVIDLDKASAAAKEGNAAAMAGMASSFGKDSRKVTLSASGRYSVHETQDGKLIFYDHNEPEPTPKTILNDVSGVQYLVHDKSDAIILKYATGRHTFVNLKRGGFLQIADAKHIEIDSSGEFVIEVMPKNLIITNLKGGPSVAAENIKVASDEEFFYIRIISSDLTIPTFYKVRKKDGVAVEEVFLHPFEPMPDADNIPRFWKQYDLEKKTVWDRVEGKNVEQMSGKEFRQDYSASPPASHMGLGSFNWFSLFGSTLVIHKYFFEYGELARDQYFIVYSLAHWKEGDFDSSGVVARELASFKDGEFISGSLSGEKVWYVRLSQRSRGVQVLGQGPMGKIEEKFEQAWISGTKSYILGESRSAGQEPQFYLIDSEGRKKDITAEIPDGFIPVDTNGKYFVFNNPQNGEMAYFDPKAIMDQPILEDKQPPTPMTVEGEVSPFFETRPANVPEDQTMILRKPGGYYTLKGASLAKEGIELKYDHVARVNQRSFIGYQQGRPTDFVRGGFITGSTTTRSVVAYTDKLVGMECEYGIGKFQELIVADDPSQIYPRAKKISLSASGRFSVHETENGKLVYYDHNEPQLGPKIIFQREIPEYFVHDKADAIIIKLRGKYQVYGLDQDVALLDKATEHIEIDSSGQFVVALAGSGTLALAQVKKEWDASAVSAKIASDERFTYVMTKEKMAGEDITKLYKFDRNSGLFVSEALSPSVGIQADLPRFWEQYDSKEKTIWDRREDQNVGLYSGRQFRQVYDETPPIRPRPVSSDSYRSFSLFGSTLVFQFDRGQNTPKVLLKAMEMFPLEDWKNDNFSDHRALRSDYVSLEDEESQNYRPLSGEKVWYEKSTRKWSRAGVVGLGPNSKIEETFDEAWVSQDKHYILGQKGGANPRFFLIDSKGRMQEVITDEFVPVDVVGNYFVFAHPGTGQVKYLDPRKVIMEHIQRGPDAAQDTRAIQLWFDEVAPKGQGWVNLVQGVYNPVFELIEREYGQYQGEINRMIAPLLERLYLAQQNKVRERFEKAVKEGQPLDQTEILPFDQFKERMNQLLPSLNRFLNDSAAMRILSMEEYNIQRDFYVNLFSAVFELGADLDIALDQFGQLSAESALDKDELYQSLLDMFGHGFKVTSPQQLKLVPVIGSLMRQLRGVTNEAVKTEDLTKVVTFLSQASSRQADSAAIVEKQVKKILQLKPQARDKFLVLWLRAFAQTDLNLLLRSITHPDINGELGDARSFVVFLTNDLQPVRDETPEEKANYIPAGENIDLPQGGIPLASIAEEEARRPKSGDKEVEIMSMDYFLQRRQQLPPPSTKTQTDLIRDIKVQRESGAYTAEITQNSKDAQAGRLEVTYYLHANPDTGRKEFVEESSDNGTGALEELALLIRKSTKAAGGQIDTTGYFGTGKFTIFEGVDRVEMITNNGTRAYMFVVAVVKDADGNPVDVKLLNVRKVTGPNVKKGVTVRRVKETDNTIPELDQKLSQRAWKVFAGLAQTEQFKISFTEYEENERYGQPLVVEHAILSESDFKAVKITDSRQTTETNFGKFKIVATKDMPRQVLDRVGLRVGEIKEGYLALVPASLRRHIQELGLNIQIPLPLIRGRSGFEHEEEYLPVIQKYVAIEFFKALAYKTLTQTNPQFVFAGFPIDWETNDDYWRSIDLDDQLVIDVAEKINRGEYHLINNREIENLLPPAKGSDLEKKLVKFILLLKVSTPGGPTSLLLRRLAIQQELDRQRQGRRNALDQMENLRKLGFNISARDIPSARTIDNYQERLGQASGIELAHQQIRNPEGSLIDPSEYTIEEKWFAEEFVPAATKLVGIEQVLLVSDQVSFAGAFTVRNGKKTILLNRSLARRISLARPELAIIDEGTNTVDHELAHLLERLIEESLSQNLWQQGFVAHLSSFSHDRIGTFADAMKYMASLWLADMGNVPVTLQDTIPVDEDFGGSNGVSSSPLVSQNDQGENSLEADSINPGGIDFNPANLDLQTQGEGIEMDFPFDPQNLDTIPLEGLTPVIFQITPVTNLPLFLGFAEDRSEALSSIR